MRVHSRLLALVAVLLAAAPLGARPPEDAGQDPLFSAFVEAKGAYQARNLDRAEAALGRMAELLASPGREAARPTVLPPYYFYSAAVAWERKETDRAQELLRRFFELSPRATLDERAYPKGFVKLFESVRDAVAKEAPPPGPESIAGGVLPDYATRGVDTSAIPVYAGDAGWEKTAPGVLLTDKEKAEFASLPDADARRAWVGRFWRSLDPRPETEENEFEAEFYRRVQYADATFSTETMRGSLSDRGQVLLVLGPPTYAGRAPLRRDQDPMNYLRTTEVTQVYDPVKGTMTLVRVPSNRATVTPGEVDGEVETWYYRKDRIPRGIGFTELQYQFITRRGYGEAVLQKDARPLLALRKAAGLLRKVSPDG